jgi:8-oxo-dGTP pyrophosphatase MutT (NUDIX family)
VVDGEGRVLLLRHTYTPGWHFPGGGVEKGETAALSMQRELKEEAGIEAELRALQLLSIHANGGFFPNDHVLIYRVTEWKQGQATAKGEIAEIRFVDPLTPPEGTSPATKRRLDEIFAGADTSELW